MGDRLDPDQLARRCAEYMLSEDQASQTLGMVLDSVAEGQACVSMEVREDMVNGLDICHGGMIFSLADSAFAFACNTQNQRAVAANCSIDFIAPAHKGDRLTARATALHQGKRNGIYDVQVSNQRGRLIAQLRGRSARLASPVLPD